jgi:hypothetical protein
MNPLRVLKCSLPVFGLLFGFAQSASLYAQDQSQPTLCSVDGPSLAQTLAYINVTLALQSFDTSYATTDSFQLTVSGNQLVLYNSVHVHPGQVDYKPYPIRGTEKAAVNDLDCHVAGGQRQDEFDITATCLNSKRCSSITTSNDPDDSSDLPSLDLPFHVDKATGVLLQQAFSHLITLLQQQNR